MDKGAQFHHVLLLLFFFFPASQCLRCPGNAQVLGIEGGMIILAQTLPFPLVPGLEASQTPSDTGWLGSAEWYQSPCDVP